jgi:inner membrane protein
LDNLCHTLVGAALGEAGLKRRTRGATATLMIASNLPDLDVLVFLSDTSPIAFRRGWTHGIVAQALLPPLLVAIVWAAARTFRRDRAGATGPPLHAGWLLLLSYIGVGGHVFMDYLNNYGVRMLAPLDWRWIYGDAVFIVDPWLWVALGTGIYLSRRRRAPAPARAAVVFAACYMTGLLFSARAARDIVADAWYDAHGFRPQAMMVGPNPVTPFTRSVIIDAGDRYATGTFSWWPRTVTFHPHLIPKNDTHPAVAPARAQSQAIRDLLVWSRFPFWIVQETSQGTRVFVADMRFAEAVTAPGAWFVGSTLLPRQEPWRDGDEPSTAAGGADAASPGSSGRTDPPGSTPASPNAPPSPSR